MSDLREKVSCILYGGPGPYFDSPFRKSTEAAIDAILALVAADRAELVEALKELRDYYVKTTGLPAVKANAALGKGAGKPCTCAPEWPFAGYAPDCGKEVEK